mmetsp:Transcript_28590/g.82781  ORF Transcript_28590/g.82781 Transcript_28590/m.82781 type:complete len:89 (+) Transcript_28590:64-330(+)
MSDGGDGDSFGGGDGEGGAFANSPTYDPSSPVDSPGGSGGGGGTTPPAADDQAQAQAQAAHLLPRLTKIAKGLLMILETKPAVLKRSA